MVIVKTEEAAKRLGVSVRQTQRLVRDRKLDTDGTDRIEHASVLHLLTARQGTHHRAWSQATAWGAVATLSALRADWMGQTQRSRLKAELKTMTSKDLVPRTRNRATIHRLRGHSSVVARIANQIISAGSTQETLGLASATDRVDGYVTAADATRLIGTYLLNDDAEGHIILRATTFDLDTLRNLATKDRVLAALDLAGSLDARERDAGLSALDNALARLRG